MYKDGCARNDYIWEGSPKITEASDSLLAHLLESVIQVDRAKDLRR